MKGWLGKWWPRPHPKSHMLRKYGLAQEVFGYFNLAIGLVFFTIATISDRVVMPPEVYGELATSIPAEVWALSIIGLCLAHLAGVIRNGNWQPSPIMRLASTIGLTGVFTAFSYSPLSTGGGDFFTICCIVMAVFYGVFSYWNAYDTVEAYR